MKLLLQPAIPLSGNVPEKMDMSTDKSPALGYFNISQSWQPRMETAQMFINQWMDRQNVVCWHKRITTSQAAWCVTAWINPDNEAFTEDANHRDQICFGSIYEKCPEQASYGQIAAASCRGLLGEWRGRTQQLKSSFLGEKKNPWSVYFRWLSFMVRIYVDKTAIPKKEK